MHVNSSRTEQGSNHLHVAFYPTALLTWVVDRRSVSLGGPLTNRHGRHRLLGRHLSVLFDMEVFVAFENVHVVVGIFDTMK